jgi:hypothetical protein
LRRRHNDLKLPYASFYLTFANEIIQIFLPSPERDRHIEGEQIKLPLFPNPSQTGRWEHGSSQTTT